MGTLCVMIGPYSPRQLLDQNIKKTASALVGTPIPSVGSHIQVKECKKHCPARSRPSRCELRTSIDMQPSVWFPAAPRLEFIDPDDAATAAGITTASNVMTACSSGGFTEALEAVPVCAALFAASQEMGNGAPRMMNQGFETADGIDPNDRLIGGQRPARNSAESSRTMGASQFVKRFCGLLQAHQGFLG
jgi:hypothetical protein